MLVFWLHAMVAIFAIMNPLGNVPIFLALTANQPPDDRRALARRSTVFAFLIIVFFALLGQGILELFGITLNAFRVGGGILLFYIAFNLLQGRSSQVHNPSPAEHTESLCEKDDLAVVPLATPILAGPGTIATVMALDSGSSGVSWSSALLVIAAAAVIVLATFLLFHNADRVRARISQTAINLLTRMMGLILTIVAVQMAAQGLKGLFPGLG